MQKSTKFVFPGTPDNFSISSVDHIHFLGIALTFQSGEFLQTCEYILPSYSWQSTILMLKSKFSK